MLIKKEYQLKVGDIVSFMGQDILNTARKKKYTVIVREIYSHWVLGHILNFENNGSETLKICMSNIDLVMQGIYKTEAIEGNAFNVPIKTELSEETIKKMQEYTETHRTKLHADL